MSHCHDLYDPSDYELPARHEAEPVVTQCHDSYDEPPSTPEESDPVIPPRRSARRVA